MIRLGLESRKAGGRQRLGPLLSRVFPWETAFGRARRILLTGFDSLLSFGLA